MEIYKDLNSPASKQFENLLNTQLSKNKIEEGKLLKENNQNHRKVCFYFYFCLKANLSFTIELKYRLKDKITAEKIYQFYLKKLKTKW